jgi:hypothetical protein
VNHERITLPGVDDDTNDTLNHLLDQLNVKAARNLLRVSYYDGKHAAKQVGTIIPPHYKRLGIVLGWSAKAVDTFADRTNLERFVWPDGDLDDVGGRDVWDANMLGSELDGAIISALIHGVSFLITTRGAVGEPDALIHAKDATAATGVWNHRRRALDSLLSITGRDDDGRVSSLALYLDGLTITAEKDGGVWAADGQEHPWGVPADPVVYKPRLGRPFGSSRISRPVMSLHDQALRTVLRLEGHMDVYSFPELWMLGADSRIFKNEDGSLKADWQVMLGRIKGIPDDPDQDDPQLARADVKQFKASDPDPHLKALKQQAQLFAGETSIPLTSLGVSDMSNPTSAESFIASREDLIAHCEKANDDYWSPPFRRAFQRALAIANGETEIPEAYASIQPKFRSPVYLSKSAQADAGMKQIAAAPWLAATEVGLELLGLTEQQIQRALAERRRASAVSVLDRLRNLTSGDQGDG